MSTNKRRFFFIAGLLSVLIVVLGGILNVALTNMKAAPAQAAPRAPGTAVTTVIAQKQNYSELLVGYGRARPLTITDVSASVAGDVVWRSPQLEAGNYVQAEELVRIDNRDLTTAVATAKARLAQANFMLRQNKISLRKLGELKNISEQELTTSQRSHERREELRLSAAISDEDYDMSLLQYAQRRRALLELQQQEELAQPEIERAQAEVDAAEAALDQAQTNLERAVVVAPYSGFIDERMVHLGTRVSVGTQLFRIVDTSQIEVPIALPAAQYTMVKSGSQAVVRLTEDGPVVWRGEVARISPMIDDQDRTFFAYLSIAGSQGRSAVPAGAFVVAEIHGARHNDVIVVPRTALVEGVLYVATTADGATGEAVIERRSPKIRRSLTNEVLLDSGVEPGERIVVTNVEKVAHGSRVVVIDRVESTELDR